MTAAVVTLETAQALQRAGRLVEAEDAYAQLVRSNPSDANAWFSFGTLALQSGRHTDAVERLQQAATLRTDAAPIVMNLGFAYQGLGALDQAAMAFSRAATIDPQLPEAPNSWGVVLLAQGKAAEAETALRRAVALRPDYARAHYNLGLALRDAGHMPDAAASFAEAARFDPDLVPAHANHGVVLQDLGDHAGAGAAYERALALNPNDAETLNNFGTLKRAQGDLDAAEALFARLLASQPAFGEAHLNLGSLRQAQGRLDDAIAAYRQALDCGARREAVFYNLGLAHERKEETEQALAAYAKASAAKPTYAEPHWNAALLHLMRGEFATGWQEYEHRWGTRSFIGKARPFTQPLWDGRRDLSGALLVWGEQGIGDEILYGRMAGELAESGLDVICEADKRLVPLFARSWPRLRVVGRRTPLDPTVQGSVIAAQIPAASLGQYLRSDLRAFADTAGPYLRPDPERATAYRKQLRPPGTERDLIVGISWVSKNPEIGDRKSSPLVSWAPILQTAGVRLVDLQYGDTAAERAAVERDLDVSLHHVPDLDLFKDIDGLAALIAACDLVITVSNSTAHIAGAVGAPLWVLVPRGYGSLWYWGAGETTPWYPSARLLRQPVAGSWAEVIEAAAVRLADVRASAASAAGS